MVRGWGWGGVVCLGGFMGGGFWFCFLQVGMGFCKVCVGEGMECKWVNSWKG